LLLHLQTNEWCWITLAVISVWSAEALNTAVEFLTDIASPEFHHLAGKAKDVAAGAVLIAAVGAVIIGLLVFGRRLLSLLPYAQGGLSKMLISKRKLITAIAFVLGWIISILWGVGWFRIISVPAFVLFTLALVTLPWHSRKAIVFAFWLSSPCLPSHQS
jgi:diacylglycerol kinase